VFGKIVQGMDVVDKIGNVATGSKGPFKEDAPLQQVGILRIERVAAP
jgi:cyclophilin family peptidyl-prolyl cis-trans isomerase